MSIEISHALVSIIVEFVDTIYISILSTPEYCSSIAGTRLINAELPHVPSKMAAIFKRPFFLIRLVMINTYSVLRTVHVFDTEGVWLATTLSPIFFVYVAPTAGCT